MDGDRGVVPIMRTRPSTRRTGSTFPSKRGPTPGGLATAYDADAGSKVMTGLAESRRSNRTRRSTRSVPTYRSE